MGLGRARKGGGEGSAGMNGGGLQGMPIDGQNMIRLLESMGVERYEPRVVNQLLEFAHKYCTDILNDGHSYAQHAGRDAVDLSDVRLAIETKLNDTFTHPPPREVSYKNK